MAFDARRHRSGQAMTEFVIALLALILIIVAMVEFLPVFLENIGLLKEVREEAGIRSLASESGTASADRKDEFSFEVPGVLPGDEFTSGHFTEKLRIPAANLPCNEPVRLPNIAGVTETMHYENRAGTSEFLSGLLDRSIKEEALNRAKGAFVGAGWTLQPIEADDALVFTWEDRAIAAVHAGYEIDNLGLTRIRLTVIARTAGGAL